MGCCSLWNGSYKKLQPLRTRRFTKIVKAVGLGSSRVGAEALHLNFMNYIYGVNSVAEALKARGRSFAWVGVSKDRHDIRLQRVVEECRRQGVAVRFVTRAELERMSGNNAHQGVVAVTSAKQYIDLEDVIAAKRSVHSLIVVLDGIEDPHN